MTDIAASANIIQVEETDFRSPDSENLKNRMGGSINYALKRNAQTLVFNGSGYHRITSLNDFQGLHYVRRNSKINAYVLSNTLNGVSGTLAINAEVYDEDGISLGNLFSVVPSIDSAIDSPSTTSRYSVGRYVEDAQDINAGLNKVVGTLNFTDLNEGYFLRFFISSAMLFGAGFNFQLWLRETS